MRAARDAGYAGPIANLSYPDGTGPVLRALGLAPTVGLGNAGMMLRPGPQRAAESSGAARCRSCACSATTRSCPGRWRSDEPADDDERCRVYLGEEGTRADSLAYRSPALASGSA